MKHALDLSSVLQLIEEHIILLSPSSEILFINQPALSLYRWEYNKTINSFFLDLLKQEDAPSPLPKNFQFPCDDYIAMKGIETIFNQDIQKIISWKLASCKFDGNKNGILLIGKNVTEIRKAEEKIFELDSIIAQAPGNLYWFSKDNIYLGCNEHSAKLLGITREEATGKDFIYLMKTLKTPDTSLVDTFIAQGQEIIESGKPLLNIEEPPFAGSDNKLRYYLANKVPLRNKYGEIYGVIGISTDITYRKELEENLRAQKEKALIASKSKSEFIANMSHDLRTPITGMLGMMQDILNAADQAKSSINDTTSQQVSTALQEIVETVQRDGQFLMGAADELLQLCNEILEIVCLESDKSDHNIESFNLYDLIEHNVELFQPTAYHKKLQLLHEIDQVVPRYLKGSRIYLDRVLLNLISNALKFTEEGRIKISVNLLNNNTNILIGEKIDLQIRVEDTGMGIPQDKFDIIFEHFSRLTPAYEGLYKGAGLGLYTVKRYVEAMQGTIDVESEVKQGTCFTVTLPFTVSDYTDRAKQSIRFPKTVQPDTEKALLDIQESISAKEAKASILIVEDQLLAAYAVALALRPFNCHVETAENGTKAIAMAQEGHYDLILMDVGLPDFSGIEVTKKIRALNDSEKSQVPIVALTGHANNPEMRQRAIDAGVQDVLSKPAQPLALESVLKAYVFKIETKKQQTHGNTVPASDLSTSLAVIDCNACVRMCNGDPEFTRKMLSMMDDDLDHVKIVLAEAYANRDMKSLRAALHRSRGGVCYLKLPELEQTLKKFYKAVKEFPQNPDRLEKTYVELQRAIDRFKTIWRNDFK